jgi:hypothetical protein
MRINKSRFYPSFLCALCALCGSPFDGLLQCGMGLTCNIDAKGRAVRLVSGIVLLIVAAVLAVVWAWPGGSWLAWAFTAAVAAGGAFQVFEGWGGWCVLRAMGIRTRL